MKIWKTLIGQKDLCFQRIFRSACKSVFAVRMSFFGLWDFQDRPPSIYVSKLKPVLVSSVGVFHRYSCIFHGYLFFTGISVVFR